MYQCAISPEILQKSQWKFLKVIDKNKKITAEMTAAVTNERCHKTDAWVVTDLQTAETQTLP